MTSSIQLLRPEGLVHGPAFSHVAIIPPGATQILIGGQNAVDSEGKLVGELDATAQVEKVMTNIDVALRAAGATIADLVSMTVLLVEGVDVRSAYKPAAEYLAQCDPPPLVVAHFVAGLAVPGALVEVSAVAAVVR